jgi:hypothetical protein
MLVDQGRSVKAEIDRLGKGGAMRRFQAKGRLAAGVMNRTETAYASALEAQRQAGTILWWKFEALKLRLAPKTFVDIDFAVMAGDGGLEMHDVKGARAIYTDDAKVKMKVAAETFPFVFKVAFPRKGGGWDIENVGG